MDRGAARQDIFLADQHRWRFLDLLAEVSERFLLEVHAYCLMDNHYHLMVHTPEPNLARAMRLLNGVYAQYFNQTLSRDGPLFRGRYKAVPVQCERYWHYLSRYIHRNPLEGGAVSDLTSYRWSSYPAYLGLAYCPDWLHTDVILNAVDAIDFRSRYRQFVESAFGEEPMLERHFHETPHPVLGDLGFWNEISGHKRT